MRDYLIVGAGLFGATVAHVLDQRGYKVLVVEKESEPGGACRTVTKPDGQIMNLFGGHIFHTNNRRVWQFVNRFAQFRQYSHHVKTKVRGRVYSFPPNALTYEQVGTQSPATMRAMFYEGYTEKMWGRPIDEVPPSVLARVPMRTDFDDHYFHDLYEGLPVLGYSPMIENMLRDIDVVYNFDYLENRTQARRDARRVIYTGPLDALYDYELGRLAWRSLRFQHFYIPRPVYQGCPTMNYPDRDVPYLREEEWSYFYPPHEKNEGAWVTRTYPGGDFPVYPVEDGDNTALADQYAKRARAAGYIVGGRLGSYRYWDMHQAVGAALVLADRITEGRI